MSLIRKIVKKTLMAPINVVKGASDALDEVVNGPKKEAKP